MNTRLNAYRAFARAVPEREARARIARARTGLGGLFRYRPELGRWEMNSSEFVSRLMAA
jgi:hypothetical protein